MPIAAVYVAAHYLTFLVFEGQAIIYLASDPFGQGWDLFGTVDSGIDYTVFPQEDTWYVQVAVVVVGHVAALALAHDRALTLYGDAKLAVRSQYWMLGVMVGFTSLALWLLAQAEQLAGGRRRRGARAAPPHACHSASAGSAWRGRCETRPVGNWSSSRSVYWKAAVTRGSLVPRTSRRWRRAAALGASAMPAASGRASARRRRSR